MRSIPTDFAQVAPTTTRKQLALSYGASNQTIASWCLLSGIEPDDAIGEQNRRLRAFIEAFDVGSHRYLNLEIARQFFGDSEPTDRQRKKVADMRRAMETQRKSHHASDGREYTPPRATAQKDGTRALIDDHCLGMVRVPLDNRVLSRLRSAAQQIGWQRLPRFECEEETECST